MPQPHEQNDEPKQQGSDKASVPSGATANQVPSEAVEDLKGRRTAGRSENPDLLEEELQQGLEESFPASDPPAVTSTAISGGSKIKGVDETLREQREGGKRKD